VFADLLNSHTKIHYCEWQKWCTPPKIPKKSLQKDLIIMKINNHVKDSRHQTSTQLMTFHLLQVLRTLAEEKEKSEQQLYIFDVP